MSDYIQELTVAKQAAQAAAQIVREFRENNSFEINYKGKNDLVTDADVASEKKILAMIGDQFPDDQVLAEESATEKILPVERTWLIDPIDGTTNFAHGFPVFCVSIALWEQQQPKVGLVLEVSSGECFHAVTGGGAFLNEQPIQVSTIKEGADAMIGTGFPYNDLSLITSYLKLFEWLLHNAQAVRRPGAAAYDLCCVAAGRFDGFYEYSLNPWDVGAASLIVKEAGGVISDWEGGDDWLFGQRVIAGNPDIQAFLLEAVQQHFSEQQLERKG